MTQPDSTDFSILKTVFRFQAKFCRESQSPFSASVLEHIAERIGEGTPYDAFVEPWLAADARKVFTDAVPLRMLGAMHGLALSGAAPELAAFYPPNTAEDDGGLEPALLAAADANAAVIDRFMVSPPQTNEVGRALCIVGGFLTVADETGLPLRCLELGASAGLNMNWDRFGYRFGKGATWGDLASPVQLSGQWTGPAPKLVPAHAVERAACDQAPIDVNDPAETLRLQSYVWPDQMLRLERLRAAIGLKQQTGGTPECADAADWAEAHVKPQAGVATVVYHSSFMPYPPQATQDRIKAAIEQAGRAASAEAPVAWLSKEADREAPLEHDEVLLRVWRGAKEDGVVRRLARVHPHGTWVDWLNA